MLHNEIENHIMGLAYQDETNIYSKTETKS